MLMRLRASPALAICATVSERGPVLVNYWSREAGSCLRLCPLLDKLVHEFTGKFLLVNVDVDAQRVLAGEHGVTSVPALKLFRRRDIVATLHGYQPERELRRFLKAHVARDTDPLLHEALQHYTRGDTERALQLLAQAGPADPQDMRIPSTLAKLLMREQRYPQAQELLRALPADQQSRPETRKAEFWMAPEVLSIGARSDSTLGLTVRAAWEESPSGIRRRSG